MTTENIVEKPEGDATPEVSAQEQLAKLQTELEQLRQDKGKAEAEAKAHQQNVSKKDKQLRESQQWQSKIEGMESKQDVLTAMVADLVDRMSLDGEEPLKPRVRKSEEYLAKLKEVKPPSQPQPPEEWIEADKAAKEVGLNILESDELAKAYRLFTRGNYEDGLTEVKKVADDIRKTKEALANQPKPKTVDQLTDAEKDELGQRWMEKKGLLVTDTGKSAGGGGALTPEKVAKMSSDERFAKRDEIAKMPLGIYVTPK